MFEDAVEKLLRDRVNAGDVLAAEAGPMPAALWSAIADHGLPLPAAPEDRGGIGAAWDECLPIARLAGYHAAPVPLVETLAANWLIGLSGGTAVADAASMAVASEGDLRGERFTGSVPDVAWGGQVRHLLIGAGGALVLLNPEDAEVAPGRNLAGEPRDTLRFTDAPVTWRAPAVARPNRVLIAGAMVRTAQIAGALARIRQLCVDHVQQRVQFGRPIARFQAVQHNLAQLAEQAALASAAAGAAFACTDPGQAGFVAAAAKQVAGEAAATGAALAHGLVGAIGFTHEFSLHLFTRRLGAWRAEFGSSRFWADAIGAAVCAGGADAYWPDLTRESIAVATEEPPCPIS